MELVIFCAISLASTSLRFSGELIGEMYDLSTQAQITNVASSGNANKVPLRRPIFVFFNVARLAETER
jgi:hypothetical protein